tara:strand:+ start:5897 stop:6511 length:615 start_codon:yes stop_codon:yes gene_type:complete
MNKTYRQLASEFKNTRSEESFSQLYQKIKPGLTSYVNKILKDPELTQDVVSTTLTKIFLKIDQYNEDYQITTWAYKIAYNDAIGKIRDRQKRVSMNAFTDAGQDVRRAAVPASIADDDLTNDEYLEEDNILQEKFDKTTEAIKSLPALYKPYMVERFLNNRSYNDILDMMQAKEKGINLQTVKNRIFRGRKLVKDSLNNEVVFQ